MKYHPFYQGKIEIASKVPVDSYYLYSDGIHHWYEVILADKSHPALAEWSEKKPHRAPSPPKVAVEKLAETG